MKSPSALEPEFTAEDWAIVEGIESEVESYIETHPDSTHMNFVPNSDPRFKRRHWNEVIRLDSAPGRRSLKRHQPTTEGSFRLWHAEFFMSFLDRPACYA